MGFGDIAWHSPISRRKNRTMSKTLSILNTIMLLGTLSARADILQTIPSPVTQGGMIHINITFRDQPIETFAVQLDPGTPILKPLTLWRDGDTLDPSDPWFEKLDPTQSALPFNSQYGFLMDAANSSILPDGKGIGIRMLSLTPGLQAYFYRGAAGSEDFTPIFMPADSDLLWNGVMWHPVFTATADGNHTAQFEIFLADMPPVGTADYTTTFGAEPGYESAVFSVHFVAVPEPVTTSLVVLGIATLSVWRRRRQ